MITLDSFNTWLQSEKISAIIKRLPNAVSMLLIVALAVMAATFIWQLVTPQSPLPTTVAPTVQAKKVVPIKDHGKIVANYHLFGKNENAKAVTKAKVARVTRLNLELYGIINRPGRKSYAIIGAKNRAKQEIYSVGEEPQSGVKIHRILPKKVLLRHSGKVEELLLKEQKKSAGNRSYIPPSRSSASLGSGRRSGSSSRTKAVTSTLPENDMSALRDELTASPQKMLEITSITEAKDKDGNLTGFRLAPGRNRTLFRKLGLRPGDIVTQVNGISLDSPAKGLMVMNDLTSADSISLTVKRGNEEVTIARDF